MLFADSSVKELYLVLRRRSERRALKPVFVRAWGDQGDRTNAVDNKKDNKELISLTLGVALLREQFKEKLFWENTTGTVGTLQVGAVRWKCSHHTGV